MTLNLDVSNLTKVKGGKMLNFRLSPSILVLTKAPKIGKRKQTHNLKLERKKR